MTISRKGFTLLELLVVGVVISVVLAISVPVIRTQFLDDPLRKSTRLVVSIMAEARERALESENGIALVVDLSAGSLAMTPQPVETKDQKADPAAYTGMEISLPAAIAAVWTQSAGRTLSGTVVIYINRRGMMEPVLIDLVYGPRTMRVKSTPFDDAVEIVEQKSSAFAGVNFASTPVR